MKTKKYLSFLITIFIAFLLSCGKSSNNSNNYSHTPTEYKAPEPTCQPSTSKVRRLVRENWSDIKRAASFTVSNKKSFEISDYGMDGDELVVNVFSRGYMYDIAFTVSFDASFTKNCALQGNVLDVYNYVKY